MSRRRMIARHIMLPLALSSLVADFTLIVIALTLGFHFPMFIAGAILLVFAAICGAFAATWWDARAPFNLDILTQGAPVRLSDDTE